MKNFNLSIALYSFAFSALITSAFVILSYFYIEESISNLQMEEKYKIVYYADKITKYKRTLKEFKDFTFGTLESFLYKIAILDKNDNVIYSTFETIPKFNPLKIIYIKDDYIIYNNTKEFLDTGSTKLILQKELEYSYINNRIFILSISIFTFLVLCSIFLYIHTAKVHNVINKSLDHFLKDAMHEIRTPLGVIQINLEFLENSVKSSMALKRAQGGLRNLTSVYESIEYFIKNKKITYKKETINLTHLLKSRIEFFRILAEIKNLEFKNHIEDILIHANIIELQRLIDNNISNAIKYSKENTTIQIKLYAHKHYVVLSFSNFGEEIKDTNKIFQRYYRGDNIRGGFGLGLNMVEYICNRYGIIIDVSSNANGLNTFSYKIPSKVIKKVN